MRPFAKVLVAAALIAMLIPLCGFAPEAAVRPQPNSDVIVTFAPVYEPLAALRGEERFPRGAQLMLVSHGKAEQLVEGFAATADANVSFDGKRVLFAGKYAASDPWQIWELTLETHSFRKLIAGSSDVIRPFYLPYGRLIYARRMPQGFQLEAAGKDGPTANEAISSEAGSTVLPLTYMAASAVPVDVLLDGRILFEAGFPLGTGSTPELFLVYSDGSGVESYRCDHSNARWGGKQLSSGDVVFTHGTSLARFTSPLATEAHIVAPHAEYAGSLAETASGEWLVSARGRAGAHYSLNLWKPGSAILQTVLAGSNADVIEPVLVAPRTRPKRHPSGLHDWSYANMMALDSRQSREGDLQVTPASVRLETFNAAGQIVVTGTAPVEADGSFFVKTPADRPIRFALLDKKGAILRQEQGWFWIRRGEQRICVGCHAGPERSSENHVPAVLLRTTTPVDLSGVDLPEVIQHASPKGN